MSDDCAFILAGCYFIHAGSPILGAVLVMLALGSMLAEIDEEKKGQK